MFSSFLSHPEICLGDHCSSTISCSMRQRSVSGVRLLPGARLTRPTARASALFHTYLPDFVLLREISRLTVEGDTPICRAMALLLSFLCSPR